VDDGGDETLSALESTYGNLPDTVTAVTAEEVVIISSNTQKAGAFLIKQSLHRV